MHKKDLFFTLSISISLAILVFLIYNFYFYYNKPALSPEIIQPIENIDSAWSKNAQFTDIKTSQQFKIGDFKGQYIFLFTSDVTNPFSIKQDFEIEKLIASQLDGHFVVISIDIGPDKDASRIMRYLENNEELDWRFTVPSEESAELLKKDFGQAFSSYSSKVILVCPNGDLIESRPSLPAVKSMIQLKEMADSCLS